MTTKFGILVRLQMFMLLVDLGFNAGANITSSDNSLLLTLFLLQDSTVAMSIIVMVISFSSTFVFQAGLLSLLLIEFAPTICVSVLYLFLSIAHHILTVKYGQSVDSVTAWKYLPPVLFVVQRMCKSKAANFLFRVNLTQHFAVIFDVKGAYM
ncbi:hypothetical protein AB6A40_005201 [Gnathostoma spinigerum]|uniref:Transmembrane protein 138 n=1 Tax=Gnathostoma spinigerum TaxID=75299 RepID=A0ABD6EGY8_9BILA